MELTVIGYDFTLDAADVALYARRDEGFHREIEDKGPTLGGKRIGRGRHHDQAAFGLGAYADQVVRLVGGVNFNAGAFAAIFAAVRLPFKANL